MKAALVREPPQVSAGETNKLQPGAARPGGPDRPDRGGQPQPTALHPPVLTSQSSRCSSPWDDSHTPPPGPLPAQPQAASIPGFTP